jgi:hypothetical protein
MRRNSVADYVVPDGKVAGPSVEATPADLRTPATPSWLI